MSRKGKGNHERYTKEQLDFIRESYNAFTDKEAASMFMVKFGRHVSPGAIAQMRTKLGLTGKENKGRIRPGNRPHNKGRARNEWMSAEGQRKALASSFRKGNVSWNHRPVGDERINKDGYIEVKIAEPDEWKLKHYDIYEKAHGTIPNGSCIVFLDGNKKNFSLSNLMAIGRGVNAILNKKGMRSADAEITKAGISVAMICMEIRRRENGK